MLENYWLSKKCGISLCAWRLFAEPRQTFHDASFLKNARQAKGITQLMVSQKAEIDLRHYQMFESGKRDLTNASFRVTMAICKAIGIDSETLLSTVPSSDS